MIPIQDTSAIKPRAGCGQTKHQKYGAYLGALKDHPDIVPYLLRNIDENPKGEILVKAVDIGPALGPYFETLGENAIQWGLKFALFTYGIFASTTKSKEINPKTNDGYMLIRLRRAGPKDELPEGLSRYLEPQESPDASQDVTQCGIDIWKM